MKLLLDLLEDGEKLILEYGGRVSLQKFDVVVAIGLEAVEEILLERSLGRMATHSREISDGRRGVAPQGVSREV